MPSSETTSVEDFYPRPPRGGRLQPVFQGKNCCLNFYPRPPRGGRPINLGSGAMRGDFYPRPPRGGRRRAENVVTADTLFLSTPSARRATHPRFCCSGESGISIHALREEGDVCGSPHAGHHKGFLSTPSARRATKVGGHGLQVRRISIHALREEGDLSRMAQNLQQVKFLSTPSARRATCCMVFTSYVGSISIHALREEGDSSTDFRWRRCSYFYPRPPRGGRPVPSAFCHVLSRFLSTPSARRATGRAERTHHARAISIHALREEGDVPCDSVCQTIEDFYPRPPRGGRLLHGLPQGRAQKISIHALREEGDISPSTL